MRLTKDEVKFIRIATILADGVYDYSVRPMQFKASYGISGEDSIKMIEKLKLKCEYELNKLDKKRIKQLNNKL